MSADVPTIAMILDPKQARAFAHQLLEAIEMLETKTIVIYCTVDPVSHSVECLDDLPEPDIIMAGSITTMGLPCEVEVLTGHFDLKYRNPTRN